MLFLFQFQSGTLNYLYLHHIKLLFIIQYNGYSIKYCIEFFMSIFILKNSC